MPAFRLSARALPRPSARVSAKLANHRVSHNQAVSCQASEGVTPESGCPSRDSTVAITAASQRVNSMGLPNSALGLKR
ncbi:hypothetical protein D3C76_461220 [compost metagenome]